MKKITLILLCAVATAVAQNTRPSPKLSAELLNADPQTPAKVIVQWKHKPTDVQHQKVVSRGGTLRRRYTQVLAGAYTILPGALGDLANDPEVVSIVPDRTVYAKLDYTAAAVNAAAAWSSNLTGSGIGIALIDSGVNANPDLSNRTRIVYSQDFTTMAATSLTSLLSSTLLTSQGSAVGPDLYGHGEHVAGILAGNGTNSTCGSCTRTLKGIAPGANIINLRVLDANGQGTDSEVIAAIDTAIGLASMYNIRVMNLSLGRPVYESYRQDPLCQAVEQAWKAGIVVVVAAGNDGRDNSFQNNGYGTIDAPGNDPYVITVGAMKAEGTAVRTDDLIASYSSKGPSLIDAVVKPDLVAPGNKVVSLAASTTATMVVQNPGNVLPKSYYQNGNSSKADYTFFQLSGTSMATPVVSGAAALLLQANPNLTPDQVKARLMLTAYKTFPASSIATDPTTGASFVSYYDVFTVGAGYLNIAAALADKSLAQGTAMSPIAVYDKSSATVGLISDPSAVWNLTTVWGVQSVFDMRTVWGVNAIDATQTVWGVNTVWGADSVNADRTVWGVGVRLNGPSTATLASGTPPDVEVKTPSPAAALSISVNGEN